MLISNYFSTPGSESLRMKAQEETKDSRKIRWLHPDVISPTPELSFLVLFINARVCKREPEFCRKYRQKYLPVYKLNLSIIPPIPTHPSSTIHFIYLFISMVYFKANLYRMFQLSFGQLKNYMTYKH